MDDRKTRVSFFILQVVEKQLASNSPPEVLETLDRLTGLGLSEEDSKHLIGSAMAVEMRSVVSEGRTFNAERYFALLQNLPHLPA